MVQCESLNFNIFNICNISNIFDVSNIPRVFFMVQFESLDYNISIFWIFSTYVIFSMFSIFLESRPHDIFNLHFNVYKCSISQKNTISSATLIQHFDSFWIFQYFWYFQCFQSLPRYCPVFQWSAALRGRRCKFWDFFCENVCLLFKLTNDIDDKAEKQIQCFSQNVQFLSANAWVHRGILPWAICGLEEGRWSPLSSLSSSPSSTLLSLSS